MRVLFYVAYGSILFFFQAYTLQTAPHIWSAVCWSKRIKAIGSIRKSMANDTLYFFSFLPILTFYHFYLFLKKTTTKAHGPLPSALPLLRFARCMKHLQSIARDACRRRWGFLAKTALELLVAKHRPNVDGHLDATVFRRSCHGSVFNGNNYNSHMSQIVTTKEAINTRSPSTK